jgi:hypothetical protein
LFFLIKILHTIISNLRDILRDILGEIRQNLFRGMRRKDSRRPTALTLAEPSLRLSLDSKLQMPQPRHC